MFQMQLTTHQRETAEEKCGNHKAQIVQFILNPDQTTSQ